VLGSLDKYVGMIVGILIGASVMFVGYSLYDFFVDDARLIQQCALEKERMVSQAEVDAIEAVAKLDKQRILILEESLKNYRKLSVELVRDKEKLSKDAEERIKQDLEDGPKVTEEDLKWLGIP